MPHLPDLHAKAARCFVITVSDSRNLDNDVGGTLIADALSQAGHQVQGRILIRDEIDSIRETLLATQEKGDVDVIIFSGGTGIAPRDLTPESLRPLLSRELPGFGEQFRLLSYQEIGPHALLSRALAGVLDRALVFALPGSPSACKLAMEKLIVPMLNHAVAQLRKV